MKKVCLYPITIEECEEGGFLAKCSSLQGCYAEGKTIKEAVGNLKDVIKAILEYKEKRTRKNSVPQFDIKNTKELKGLNVALVC